MISADLTVLPAQHEKTSRKAILRSHRPVYWLRFYIPLDTKHVISEMLFPANLLTSTQKTKSHLPLCGWCYLFNVSSSGPFSGMLVFPVSLSLSAERGTFKSCNCEFRPMTLSYETDLNRAEVNHHAIIQVQRSLITTVTIQTCKQTESQPTDGTMWTQHG